jgi:O-antigen/teichoic acid export membrane protein
MTERVIAPPPGPVPPSRTKTAHLDRTLAKGVAWTAAAKWSSQILSWGSLLAIAHLLAPSDFGLVGMAAIYLGLVTLFSEFGVGTAILTLRDLTEEQIAQLNSVSVLAGLVSFLISCAVAVPLGLFFHAPKLPAVVVAMSTTFIVLSLRSVPYGLLQKDMRFRLLSVLETLQSMGQALTALLLAFFGFGYWALVLGNVVGSVLLTGLTAVYRRHGFARPRFESIRKALHFSGHVLASRLCWYGYSNADFLMAGRVLGASPLGEYTLAWNLATAPIEKISAVVVRVTPALFSAVQTEHAALRRYLRVLTEGLALLAFPSTFGLALVAREFVPLALGQKWQGAIVPLQLLALYASLRAIVTLLPQVLVVVGETRFAMWNSVAALVLMPIAFYLGSHWGTTGIATAWIVAYPLIAIPLYCRTLWKIQLKVGEYMRGVWPPLNGSIVMAVAVFAVKWASAASWPLLVRLTLEVLAGAAAYALVMLGIYGSRMRALWDLGRGLLKQEPSL